MDVRGIVSSRSYAVVVTMIVVSFFVWVTPAGAIKVERSDSPPAQKDQKHAPAKESGDTARIPTRSLLNDVESQKKTETARDSLDTWIDRDGDGVNDKMKKRSTKSRPRVKERQPEPVQTAQPKTEPEKQKQDPESSNKSTTKRRRR